jgi:hypothetical protein
LENKLTLVTTPWERVPVISGSPGKTDARGLRDLNPLFLSVFLYKYADCIGIDAALMRATRKQRIRI